MNDNQSQTESLLDLVRGIDAKTILLPEFQRDFRWELEQTYDLFDSLIRDIFIGTVIYGKPAFAMTLREIDRRPRKGAGSRAALAMHALSAKDIGQQAQTKNLRIVLDGQQRVTSIYRALTGIDGVHVLLRKDIDNDRLGQLELEEMIAEVVGDERADTISVKLVTAYELETQAHEDEDLDERFGKTLHGRQLTGDPVAYKAAARIYRRAAKRLVDLFKQQKMVAYYLLDMRLDKFCLFFERSNSRGIQLNFTDILAAKLYHGFNLRKKIDEFESQHPTKRLNREIIIRAIAYICGEARGGTIAIEKAYILKELEASDFTQHWDDTCRLYVQALNYLIDQHYIVSQSWMPSENMVVPLIIFQRALGGTFDRMTEEQRKFLEFWYWASIFANRYSSASNEVIITDSATLTQVAQGKQITARTFFTRLRPLITEPADLFSYAKRTSIIYRGVLNLLGYAAQGLKDWKSTQRLTVDMQLEDHHIYPRAYITSRPPLDSNQDEAEQLVDSVVNRTLIPKLLNIKIGKKAPSAYLSELKQSANAQLDACLITHSIPANLSSESAWDGYFRLFLDERAREMFALIERYAIAPAPTMAARYGSTAESSSERATPPAAAKPRLRDLLADRRVQVGDRLYARVRPDCVATIVNGDTVDYEGTRLLINAWGQQMTGWQSINIYESLILERTGEPLNALR